MKGLIYALLLVLALGIVSAYPAVVTGTVFDQNAIPVAGADVSVDCNSVVLTDTTDLNGAYYVVFDSADCDYLDSLTVDAQKDDAQGTSQGQMCDSEQCFIPVAIVNVTIPEFGVVAGLVSLIGALGIVAYRKKN